MASAAHGQEIATYRWQVRQDRIIDRTWAIKRQEAVILEPSYANASGPVDLEAVYEVKLRWRPYGSTNAYAYATDGQVTAAASGTVQCVWLPAYAADGSEVYEYEIGLKSEAGQNLRAGGLLNMVGSLADQPATPLPSTLIPFDWSLITEHLNTASAPFATTSTVAALDACVTGVETGKLDKTDATYTNTVALAAGALQRSGGTMTGSISAGGQVSVDPVNRRLTSETGLITVDYKNRLLMVGSNDEYQTVDWGGLYLYGGWMLDHEATNGKEIVNYDTATTLIGTAATNYPGLAMNNTFAEGTTNT